MGKSAKERTKDLVNKAWREWKLGTIPREAFQTVASQEYPNLATVGVALTHNFSFAIFRTKKSPVSDTDGGQAWSSGNIIKLNDISIPDIGLQFQNVAETGYLVNAMISEMPPLTVRYWDTADLSFTRNITMLYDEQFDKDGLLRVGYNQYQVEIRDNGRELTLFDCAITKPHYDNMSAQLGLKMFSFQVTYEDYKEKFV